MMIAVGPPAPAAGQRAVGDEVNHQHRDDRDGKDRRRRHREGFGERQRFEKPAAFAAQHEHRQKTDGDDQQAEKQAGPDLLGGFEDDFTARACGWPPARARRSSSWFRCLCAFSIMMIALSTTTPTAMAMPPRLMMLALMPSRYMTSRLIEHAAGDDEDGDQRAAAMQQENDADEGDDDHFLDEGVAKGVDGALDEIGAVVDGLDHDAGRKSVFQIR